MVANIDKLPHSNAGRCTVCNGWLFYQRVDRRLGVFEHYFFCRRCRRRYAAWEAGWTPRASVEVMVLGGSFDVVDPGGQPVALPSRRRS